MTHGILMKAALASTVAALSISQTAIGFAQTVRTLVQNAQPIVSRLLPDDQVVIVQRLSGPPLPPPPGTPTRATSLEQLARLEEVAVIHEPKSQSFFVLDSTWLNTRVHARVMHSLKTNRLGTAPGRSIEFELEGGALEVSGR
jgi:hypothetical protein